MEQTTTQALRPLHASAVNLAINNSDFVLVFVQMTPMFGETGLVDQLGVEPLTSISLSPITAKQLRNQLNLALENFEQATNASIPDLGTASSR